MMFHKDGGGNYARAHCSVKPNSVLSICRAFRWSVRDKSTAIPQQQHHAKGQVNQKGKGPSKLATTLTSKQKEHKTRGQSNLTKSASRVRGHPRGSKVVPLNSCDRVSY